MSTSTKNKQAAGAIQTLSADIFYARVRNDQTESDSVSHDDENFPVSSSGDIFLPENENIAGHENIPEDLKSAKEYIMPNEENIARHNNILENSKQANEYNIPSEKNLDSYEKLSDNISLTRKNNISDEEDIIRHGNMLAYNEQTNINISNKENLSGYEKFDSDIFLTQNENVADGKNIARPKNMLKNNNDANEYHMSSEKNLSSYGKVPGTVFAKEYASLGHEKLGSNVTLASENNITNEALLGKEIEHRTSSIQNKNIANEENIAEYGDISSHPDLLTKENSVGEKNLALNTLLQKNTLPLNSTNRQEFLSNDINSATTTLPAKKIFPLSKGENIPQLNPSNAPLLEENSQVTHASGNNNLREYSSSNLKSTTTRTGNITNEEIYLASHRKTSGKKNIPIEDYKGSLFDLVGVMGLSSLGMLIILRHILPPEGGIIRVNALARSIGMSANNIRLQLENLQEKGIIATNSGGTEGKWVSFTHSFLKSNENPFKKTSNDFDDNKNMTSEENTLGNINIAGHKNFDPYKFTRPIKCKEFFFACHKIGKTPEEIQPSVVEEWLRVANELSSEHAVGIIFEFLSQAKSNTSAYLHTLIQRNVSPSPAKMDVAKEFLETIKNVAKKIGEEILPKDWIQAMNILGFKIKLGDLQDLARQQTVISDRLDKFITSVK
jgi:hypothetical protein